MPRYLPDSSVGLVYVRPVGVFRRLPLLRRIGWHQTGSHIRLKMGIKRLAEDWPSEATISYRRSCYSGSVPFGPFVFPSDWPIGKTVQLYQDQAYEVSGEGHHNVTLKLGDHSLEVARFNVLQHGVGVAVVLSGIAATTGIITLLLKLFE